jgi:hypothetical protein
VGAPSTLEGYGSRIGRREGGGELKVVKKIYVTYCGDDIVGCKNKMIKGQGIHF